MSFGKRFREREHTSAGVARYLSMHSRIGSDRAWKLQVEGKPELFGVGHSQDAARDDLLKKLETQ